MHKLQQVQIDRTSSGSALNALLYGGATGFYTMDSEWAGNGVPLEDAVNFSGEKLIDYGTFCMSVKKEVYFDTVEISDINTKDVLSVDFYTGCRPPNISYKPTGNLICSAKRQGDYNFFTGLIIYTGVGGYFRLINKKGVSVFDGIIATAGTDLNMDTSFKAGDLISINSSKLSN